VGKHCGVERAISAASHGTDVRVVFQHTWCAQGSAGAMTKRRKRIKYAQHGETSAMAGCLLPPPILPLVFGEVLFYVSPRLFPAQNEIKDGRPSIPTVQYIIIVVDQSIILLHDGHNALARGYSLPIWGKHAEETVAAPAHDVHATARRWRARRRG